MDKRHRQTRKLYSNCIPLLTRWNPFHILNAKLHACDSLIVLYRERNCLARTLSTMKKYDRNGHCRIPTRNRVLSHGEINIEMLKGLRPSSRRRKAVALQYDRTPTTSGGRSYLTLRLSCYHRKNKRNGRRHKVKSSKTLCNLLPARYFPLGIGIYCTILIYLCREF